MGPTNTHTLTLTGLVARRSW